MFKQVVFHVPGLSTLPLELSSDSETFLKIGHTGQDQNLAFLRNSRDTVFCDPHFMVKALSSENCFSLSGKSGLNSSEDLV